MEPLSVRARRTLAAIARCFAVVTTLGLATGLPIRPAAARDGVPATVPSAPDVPMREHAPDVVDYVLRAKLDPVTHTLHGEGTITWRNVARTSVSELWLHLYLNAFKNQSSVFLRAPVGGFRGSTVPKEWGTIDVRQLTWLDGAEKRDLWAGVELRRKDDDDETDARVPLPHPVEPGQTITLEMVWDDKLPSVVERTGFDGSFHMVAQWFPKIAKIEEDGRFAHFPFHHLGEFYADFGSYDVTIDVPEAFVVGAVGPVTESKVEGGRRIERHVQGDIHDFAFTAWDRFRTRSETIDGVACTILYPPNYEDHAERELEAMRFALPHFGARYGKYPYGVLTLVHPPSTASEAGGMEYPTLITTGDPAITPRGVNLVEITTIHEFGHQYFYGLVASHETDWPFLDEGLNSYAENEALAQWKGTANAVSLFGLDIGDVEAQSESSLKSVHDDRIAQPAFAFGTGASYGALVYSRTAALLETVRRVYGDAAMQRALGAYARRFRFAHPTPQDFIATIQREIGPQAGELVRGAVFDKGWVDFKVASISSHVARAPAGLFDVGGKRETVPADRETAGKYTGWVLVNRRGTLNLPVEVELVAADGTKTRVPWDGATDAIRIPYAGTSALASVVVDPDSRVLIDQDRTNDFATASGHTGGGAPRTLERATYWAELLLGAVAP
jgi:Peptidase family M1 domain